MNPNDRAGKIAATLVLAAGRAPQRARAVRPHLVWVGPFSVTRATIRPRAFRHEFVKANGLVIHFSDQGRRDGPPLVFINSLGTDFRIWNEVAEILAPDFRIVLYDKRGHGLSESGPDRNDMADYASDLMGLLDVVGVRRATIVGLSIGGLIAQELIVRAPNVSPRSCFATRRRKSEPTRSGTSEWVRSSAVALEALADATLERWFTADFRARRSAELAGMRAMLTRTPKQGYLAACGALKRADLRPYAGGIQAPTLCLVGDEDGSTPVALVKETAALIPGSASKSLKAQAICQTSRSRKSWRGWSLNMSGGPGPARGVGRPQGRGTKEGRPMLQSAKFPALPVIGMRGYRHPPFDGPVAARSSVPNVKSRFEGCRFAPLGER